MTILLEQQYYNPKRCAKTSHIFYHDDLHITYTEPEVRRSFGNNSTRTKPSGGEFLLPMKHITKITDQKKCASYWHT